MAALTATPQITLRPARMAGQDGHTDDEATVRALVTADLSNQFRSSGIDPATAAGLIDLQYVARCGDHAERFPHADRTMIEIDGIPIGLIVTATDGDALRLVDLIIDARHRGHGIGTRVLAALCAHADAAGKRSS